jgi:hypothetical protein
MPRRGRVPRRGELKNATEGIFSALPKAIADAGSAAAKGTRSRGGMLTASTRQNAADRRVPVSSVSQARRASV